MFFSTAVAGFLKSSSAGKQKLRKRWICDVFFSRTEGHIKHASRQPRLKQHARRWEQESMSEEGTARNWFVFQPKKINIQSGTRKQLLQIANESDGLAFHSSFAFGSTFKSWLGLALREFDPSFFWSGSWKTWRPAPFFLWRCIPSGHSTKIFRCTIFSILVLNSTNYYGTFSQEKDLMQSSPAVTRSSGEVPESSGADGRWSFGGVRCRRLVRFWVRGK